MKIKAYIHFITLNAQTEFHNMTRNVDNSTSNPSSMLAGSWKSQHNVWNQLWINLHIASVDRSLDSLSCLGVLVDYAFHFLRLQGFDLKLNKWVLTYHFQNSDTLWQMTGGIPLNYHLKAYCLYFMAKPFNIPVHVT